MLLCTTNIPAVYFPAESGTSGFGCGSPVWGPFIFQAGAWTGVPIVSKPFKTKGSLSIVKYIKRFILDDPTVILDLDFQWEALLLSLTSAEYPLYTQGQ